jgi:hypothetical protein
MRRDTVILLGLALGAIAFAAIAGVGVAQAQEQTATPTDEDTTTYIAAVDEDLRIVEERWHSNGSVTVVFESGSYQDVAITGFEGRDSDGRVYPYQKDVPEGRAAYTIPAPVGYSVISRGCRGTDGGCPYQKRDGGGGDAFPDHQRDDLSALAMGSMVLFGFVGLVWRRHRNEQNEVVH